MPNTHEVTTAPTAEGSASRKDSSTLEPSATDPAQDPRQRFNLDLQHKEERLKAIVLLQLAVLSFLMVLLNGLTQLIEEVVRLWRELLATLTG
jgi:hypothetical protein